jgi:hypothetical protein
MSQLTGEIRKALLIWCLANILGLSIPPLIIYLVTLSTATLGLLSTTLIISMPLSIAQWAALRRIMPISILWIFSIPTSILAMVVIIREVSERFLGNVDPEPLIVMTSTFFLIGLIIGLPQWLILRRECDGVSIWLLGTVLGVGLGASIVIATDLVNISGVIAYIVAVLIYVAATGLSLSWLLIRREQPEEPGIHPA